MVDHRIAQARRLIEVLSESPGHEVSAAFWMDAFEDDNRWTIYLVYPIPEGMSMLEQYLFVMGILIHHPEIEINRDDILLRSPDDPVVAEVLDFVTQYPASDAARLRGIFLKGHFVERAYIYAIKLNDESEQLKSVEKSATD